MKQALTPEQKNKIYIYSASGFIFVMLIALTIVSLVTVHKQSRDTIRLSSINILRGELLTFYHNRNKFPQNILLHSEVKREEECYDNLCLYDYPSDPDTGERFAYTSCFDAGSESCQADTVDARGYRIDYRLESRVDGLSAGPHFATPEATVN